jgi:tetratricopeptide (TPR) repeat protein
LGGIYCDLAELIRRGGQREQGLLWFDRACQMLEPVCNKEKDNDLARRYLANTYEGWANNLRVLHRSNKGIPPCLKALALREELVTAHPGIPLYQEDQSRTLEVLALMYEDVGESAKALETVGAALRIVRQIAASHPTVTSFRQDHARILGNLANSHRRLGQPEKGVELLRESLAIYQQLTVQNPSVLHNRMEKALGHGNLAAAYLESQKPDQAAEQLRVALDILSKLPPTFTRVTELHGMVAAQSFLLADFYAKTDQTDKAIAFHSMGLAIRQQLASRHPDDSSYAVRLGGDYCNEAHFLKRIKHYQEAHAAYDQAVRTLKAVLATDDANQTAAEFLGNTYDGLASLYQETKKPDEAEKIYLLAVSLREKLAAEHGNVVRYRVAVGNVKAALAILYYNTNKLEPAAAMSTDALVWREKLANDYPDVVAYRADLAYSHFNLGLVQHRAKQGEQAVASFGRALEIQEELVAKHPQETRYQTDLAKTCSQLAQSQALCNQLDGMFTTIERELAAYRRLTQEHPQQPTYQEELARTYRKMGEVRVANRQPDQAVAAFREAESVVNTLLTSAAPDRKMKYLRDLADAQIGIGKACRSGGEFDEALAALDKATALVSKLETPPAETTACRASLAKELIYLAEALRTKQKYKEAEAIYRRTQEPAQELLKANPKLLAYQDFVLTSFLNLGACCAQDGRPDQALEAFRQGATVLNKLDRKPEQALPNQVGLYRNFTRLGDDYLKLKKPQSAAEAYGLAIEQAKRVAAAQPDDVKAQSDLMIALGKLGELHKNMGKLELAIEAYQQQLPITERLMKLKPEIAAFAGLRGSTYLALGRLAIGLRKFDQAADQLDKGIAHLEDALKREKVEKLTTMEQTWLRDSCTERARALAQLGRPKDALAVLDRALELSEGRQRGPIRASRACALAGIGDHAQAVAEAEEVAQQKDVSAGELYDAACAMSLAAAVVLKDAKLPLAEQKKRAEQHAARAVALLRQAKSAGMFRSNAQIDYMKNDSDLDPLRDRDDYRQFLADIMADAQPKDC